MKMETIGRESLGAYQILIYRHILTDGRLRFVAETETDAEDRFILDHWNLGALRRQIREVLPIRQMFKARL
jgi:hypothetical protein